MAPKHQGRLPPHWFMWLFWMCHRRVVAWTRGRLGLWHAKPGRWGTLRLHTVGRRTGEPRAVIVGYIEDGPNLVTMAMNGWNDAEPAWWLNLQAHPAVTVDTPDGPREVTAHAAEGAEYDRLWARWRTIDRNLDGFASRRSMRTAVVVLEPRPSE
jgi:deazaflavin-dependent oxidoreductase (nitroreductase family)